MDSDFFRCSCPRQRTCIYVGRAVQVRARLQVHAFGRSSTPPSEWLFRMMDDPHNHMPLISIWYMPKNELLRAEAWLIDNLHPSENRRDRGFSAPSDWAFRAPDVDGVDIEMLEPDRHHRRNIARFSDVRHDPGVYAWWIDSAGEFEAASELVSGIVKAWR